MTRAQTQTSPGWALARPAGSVPSTANCLPPRQTMTVAGGRLSFVEAGRGEPVLLLHGYPQSSLTWRHQFGPLSQQYRVVAPDWFGWGESERRFDQPARYWDEVERLGALLDALEMPDCNLIVHDYAAYLGLGFAGRYPRRIRRLAVLNSRAHRVFPPAPYALFWLLCATGRLPALRQLMAAAPLGWLHRQLMRRYVDRDCFSEAQQQEYIGWLDTVRGRRWLLHFFRYYELPERPDLLAGLHNIRCPAAIIWGDRDPYCPWATATDLAARLPDTTLTRLAGADHYVMEERPAAVLAALEELLRRPAQACYQSPSSA